ncbi:hypothetical protein GNY06_08335 [Elizabethkingia argentiflava]|uniref:Chorismate-utilising enzyme C-terminal domain-containing protein n=1 Tax=Elizabethkingia argenteiflava TaxID=2681556 RepID=A0A845PYF4_9FLAO|nr:chorismate-binding protein [Elizabethkingia argenteiflava]NAW51388.1 hypothetical protein [Elizabethkingia argenteiflava]
MQTVLFKFPFEDTLYTLDDKSYDDQILRFHAFDNSEEVIFQGRIKTITPSEILDLKLTNKNISQEYNGQITSKEEYFSQLKHAIEFIKQHQLPKVVLSRQKWLAIPSHQILDIGASFLKLCEDYPNAFIHFFVNNNRAWIGATPELLGQYTSSTQLFETMSLAGTLPLSEKWSTKEIEEQKPVSEYIESVLSRFSEHIETSPIYDHISGNIKHLRNDFKTNIPPRVLPKLIQALHPTPAVCGTPKPLCFEIIKNTEKHKRDLYAGYIQIAKPTGISYYVNLRCAQLFRNGILLYAGGGITQLSEPEKEWVETELKSDAVRQRLSFLNANSTPVI